jgi:hypothetical protein
MGVRPSGLSDWDELVSMVLDKLIETIAQEFLP